MPNTLSIIADFTTNFKEKASTRLHLRPKGRSFDAEDHDKSSGYNQNNSVNIVQIRLWQDCDYIIQSISDDRATTFVLTHAEMMLEMERLKASPAHGTKEIVADNKKIEYMMTVERGSADWDRWINNYRKADDIFQV